MQENSFFSADQSSRKKVHPQNLDESCLVLKKNRYSHVSDDKELHIDEQVLKYASESFKYWSKNALVDDTELSQFSLFLQLNDGESDLMANWTEILRLISVVDEMGRGRQSNIGQMKAKAKELFDMHSDNNFLDFRSFQEFLEEMKFPHSAEEIDKYLYQKYYTKNCCVSCIGGCCKNPFRKVRMKQTANRLMKYIQIENKRTPTKPADFFLFIIKSIQVASGLTQIFDFYSDVLVMFVIYSASFESKNKKSEDHYQIALIVCFLSLASTFMATQSCIIGMKFAQGDFEPHNFKHINCISKFLNFLLLTFIGIALLVPLEILENMSKLFQFFGLLVRGSKGAEKVDTFFTFLKSKFTGLNPYQLQSIEQQRKVFALLFENLPFTILLVLIEFSVLKCDELLEGKASITIVISLLATILQIFATVIMAYIESKWLKEPTLSYLMTKMTANNNWIPYIHLITKRKIESNINFGDLAIRIPFVSHAFGFQQQILFEFSDNSLTYLLNELKIWSSEVRGQAQEQRYRLIFTQNCLNQVSLNTFIHFVKEFPEDVFILEIQLDWNQFYQDQVQGKRIKYTIEDGEKRMYSPTGEPLLLLCIKNECCHHCWHLKTIFSIILDSGHYALYDSKNGSPLTVALQHNCFESIDIINNGDYNFDYQMKDSQGLSFLGHLMQKLLEIPDEHGAEYDKLAEFTKTVYSDIVLDMHLEQYPNTGTTKKQISAWQVIFKNMRHHRSMRFATKAIVDVAVKQKDYKLNNKEKNTLFKNAIKLLVAHSNDIHNTWLNMCYFLKQGKVNIFEMKDQRGEGIEHRLIQAWPIPFHSQTKVNNILKSAMSDEMKQKSDNPTALIFQKAVESDQVIKILEGSIYGAKLILRIDSESGQQIKSLDNPKLFRQTVSLLGTCLMINMVCYADLEPQIVSRVKDTKKLKEEVTKWIENQYKFGKVQSNKNQDKDDLAEFDAGKLTRCKPGNGQLKRKVCDEIQQDPTLLKLSTEQLKAIGISENPLVQQRRKKLGEALRYSLETILEWIAAADLYTDILVLIQLLQTDNRAWATITIFALLSPFFACQTPFLMFLKEKVYRDKEEKIKLKLMSGIMVSPFMLIYMFILDIIFVINQAIIFPVIGLLKIVSFGLIDLACLSSFLDRSYEFFFEMQRLEAAGFRRMRTISQLTFETLIQIILQVRMLMYFRAMKNENAEVEFGVSLNSISISLLLSFAHAMLEAIFIYMESSASRTSFINYAIVCFNGRFGWVPYNDYLITTSQQILEDEKSRAQKSINTQTLNQIELDFQNIQSRVLCLDMHVEFQFTDDTLLSLSKTLAAFPTRLKEKSMPIVRFGHTINNVRLENVENLLRVCKQKILIDLKGTDLRSIYLKSSHAALLTQSNAQELSKDDKNYLFDLQKSKINQLLFFLLKENDENLKATILDPINKTQVNFADIALRDRDGELLSLLLSLESNVFKSQMSTVSNRNSLTLHFINTIDFDLWVALSSNSSIFNPHQESLIFQAFMDMQTQDPAMFRRSMQWWHARFGPGMPQEIINDVMRFSPAFDFMKLTKNLYPEKVYVRKGMQFTEIECRTAFKFAAVRRLLVKAWEITATGPTIDPEQSEGTFNKPLDISDLQISLADFKLLNMIMSDVDHSKIKNLTGEKVNELDEWVKKLMLDTHRYVYIGRTRIGDDTGHQIEAIFYGKDQNCLELHKQYDIEAGFNKRFDTESDDQHTYYTSLEVKTPKLMTWITYHKTSHSVPNYNTSMSTFIIQQDHVLRGFLFNWIEQKNCQESGDAVKMAQMDELSRVAAITSAKPFYQMESVLPNSTVRYCGQSQWSDTTLHDLRVTMHIDFPYGTDIKTQQSLIEAQAQLLRRAYEKDQFK